VSPSHMLAFDRSLRPDLAIALDPVRHAENRNGPLGDDGSWCLGAERLTQCSSVPGRRHTGGPPERAREARLRGKLAIKSDFVEGRAPRRDHRLRVLQPPSADVAMRRHAHGAGKCTGEMKDAEACDIGELGDGDVSGEMFFDVTENAAQSRTIKLI